ncbi:MAG: haloalkane dehalogenase [Actinomycetota bacterium]
MKSLRTPDERFEGLVDYPFKPNFTDLDGLRMHYVDEGPADALPVLLMHGEPTWSYLYRKVIPAVSRAGFRAIAPDLIGFGRSDKPVIREEHSYSNHVDWMTNFIQDLGLSNITLVGHDWGGLIGLRMVAEVGHMFSQVMACNTFLPTGDIPASAEFIRWLAYSQESAEFHPGALIDRGSLRELSLGEITAYDAPFPDDTYKAGPRVFPTLVPITQDDPSAAPNKRAWETLAQWTKPFITAFSDSDPITRGGDVFMQSVIPGTKGQPHTTIHNAGHFAQEDNAPQFTDILINFLKQK